MNIMCNSVALRLMGQILTVHTAILPACVSMCPCLVLAGQKDVKANQRMALVNQLSCMK